MFPLITNMLTRLKYSSFVPMVSRVNGKGFSASVVVMDSERPNFPLYSERGNREMDKKLLEPFTYINLSTDVYSKATNAFNYWLKVPKEKEEELFDLTITLTFKYYVLIDDIMDSAELRDGLPVPTSIYGMGRTLNATNYGLFIILERILALDHPEAANLYIQNALAIHREQGMEMYWRDNFIIPSEAEYKNMTIGKIGGYLNMIIGMLQLYSKRKDDFQHIIDLTALYIQIRDDYFNLCSIESAEKKGFCEDIGEGKFSFPVVHAINSKADGGEVLKILKKRTRDLELKKHCLNLLDKLGSLAYTRETMSDLERQIKEAAKKIGDNPLLIPFLDFMNDWKTGENYIIKP